RSDNAYWEGACEVLDLQDNRIGLAYLELAGYGGGLGARLN
ncbi:MAG: lipocalin family protein, partial [Verrucomicrobiia bacterium]